MSFHNDLQSYQNLSVLYRNIALRQQLSPIFLHRNVRAVSGEPRKRIGRLELWPFPSTSHSRVTFEITGCYLFTPSTVQELRPRAFIAVSIFCASRPIHGNFLLKNNTTLQTTFEHGSSEIVSVQFSAHFESNSTRL